MDGVWICCPILTHFLGRRISARVLYFSRFVAPS
nr:MAG TPA: hypothetical protein [Caudoviricetes sp.]